MSEPWLAWVDLRASRLRRWVLALALAASLLTTALMAAAWARAPCGVAAMAAVLAAAAAVAARLAGRRAGRAPHALHIDATGRLWTRCRGQTLAAEPVFVSSWVICLRTGPRRVVAVWRDALCDRGYRRLAAAGRWGPRRTAELNRIPDPMA